MRPHLLRRARAAAALALAAASTGCFRYQTLPPDAPPGRDVRVSIDPAAAATLAAALGPRAGVLEGRLVGRTDSSVTVAVRTVTRLAGDEERWSGDAVVVPLGAVQRVERRRVDVVRTAIAVGGVVAAALLARGLSSESTIGGGGGNPPAPGR